MRAKKGPNKPFIAARRIPQRLKAHYFRGICGTGKRVPLSETELDGNFLETMMSSESGNSLVELALLFSFFIMPLLVGTGEMGLLAYESIEVVNAAHVGAAYGMQSMTFAANTSEIVTAAQAEASDFGTLLTVTPTTYYACSLAVGGTQYTGSNAQSQANAACTGGTNHALQFVQVNASVVVTPLLKCKGLPTSYTLRGQSVMEVE